MIEQNTNASQMHEAEVILNLVLVAHDDAPIVLQPSVQPFSLPTAFVAPELAAILGGWFYPLGTMRRNDFDATLSQLRIQRVRVIRFVTNQAFGFIRDKTGSKCGFSEGDFMRRSTRYVNGDRKARAVCNCHDLATFAALGLAHCVAPFLADTNVPSMKHSDKSNSPRSFRSVASALKMASNTPVLTHSWKRAWHTDADGYRSGISFHCAPVRMIHKMPLSTSRSERAGRPRPSARRGLTGIWGSTIAHCSSVKSMLQSPLAQVTAFYHF